METLELLQILANGEDSKHQFKVNMSNVDALAAEMVAFSNGMGGKLIIGVDDDGSIVGLSSSDIARLNQLISNSANQSVRPAINPFTENITIDGKTVMIITVEKGLNKPYMDNQGLIWVKSGADKRKVTAREELQRMFQTSALIHADEIPVKGSSLADLDIDYFSNFFEKLQGEKLDNQDIPLSQLLKNMNLMQEEELNICGMLLFAKAPQFKLPEFIVKAISYQGNDITEQNYRDSRDIQGKLSDVFQQAVNFVLLNIHHQQNEQGFNSVGQPEIPRIVLEELIANALIHRDYFISSSVRLFIFQNRIEIISPGHLPNNLTVENIRYGNSNTRNPILASFSRMLLPYRGIGSGIMRALQNYPDINFIDDRNNNLFRVIIYRKNT